MASQSPSLEAQRIAETLPKLTVNDLYWLKRKLEDMGYGGPSGVREPRTPRPPLDARGVALDADVGRIGLHDAIDGHEVVC